MKIRVVTVLSVLTVLSCSTYAAAPAKPAVAKKPVAKKPVKKLDPKEEALKARFGGHLKSHREALLALDAEYSKAIDVWVELRDTLAERNTLDKIWGVRARKDAEKRKKSIDRDVYKLNLDFKKYFEKAEKDVDKDYSKKRKELDKFLSRRAPTNERALAIHNKELGKLRDEADHFQGMLAVLETIKRDLSRSDSSHTGTDRLSQIGISGHDGVTQALKKKTNNPYTRIIEAAYDVKDCKADIAALEARKAEGKNWTMRDDGELKRANYNLEKAGMAIEKLVVREKAKLDRDIVKMKKDIERLSGRIEGAREGSSSQARYQQEKWDLEAELLGLEQIAEKLVQLAQWKPKPKPAKKAAAKKPAAKKPAPKKAGH